MFNIIGNLEDEAQELQGLILFVYCNQKVVRPSSNCLPAKDQPLCGLEEIPSWSWNFCFHILNSIRSFKLPRVIVFPVRVFY